MLPIERARNEQYNVSHNYAAMGYITAAKDGRIKKFFSEDIITPGVYDIVTAQGECIRLLMQRHPDNIMWGGMPYAMLPYDCVTDSFDVTQVITSAKPNIVAGVGSVAVDVPAGEHRLVQRHVDISAWSAFTVLDYGQ